MSDVITFRKDAQRDVVSLGQILSRLAPTDRMTTMCARCFHLYIGGAELNVAMGGARVFDLRTACVTALTRDGLGLNILGQMRETGTDTRFVKLIKGDKMGEIHNPVTFVDDGFGERGSQSVQYRYHTPYQALTPDDLDWEAIFGPGVKLFHVGGIALALNPELVLQAVQKAVEHGAVVSADFNLRTALWEGRGGLAAAIECNRRLVKLVQIAMANEEEWKTLGVEVPDVEQERGTLTAASYKPILEEVVRSYPHLKIATTTLRDVVDASENGWGAVAYAGGRFFEHSMGPIKVLDRVGGGDSFDTGLFAGLLKGLPFEEALKWGVAHGALAVTTPGDLSMVTEEMVRDVAAGKGARANR